MKRPWLSATIGAALWVTAVRLSPPDPVSQLLLFAILVIVPLALPLLAPPEPNPLYEGVVALQPWGALLALLSYTPNTGGLAGALAAGWFLWTMLLAIFGVTELRARGLRPREEAFIRVACVYMLVGGGGFALFRAGLRPLGFSSETVLLTAIHFHYAGFAAPVILGATGRGLTGIPLAPHRSYRWAGWGLLIAIPLLALGIAFSPLLEGLAAGVLALAMIRLATLILFRLLPAPLSPATRVFLTLCGLSSLGAMILALTDAWDKFTGQSTVGILSMAKTHGALNAFGFSLCGLLACRGDPSLNKPRTTALNEEGG